MDELRTNNLLCKIVTLIKGIEKTILVNLIPSSGKNHWAYAISCQGHCKTSTDNWIKVEKTGVEINRAKGSRCDHYRLKSLKYRLYCKRSVVAAKLEMNK